jgi:hypothetical protein
MDKLYLRPDYDLVTGHKMRKVIDSIMIYSYIYVSENRIKYFIKINEHYKKRFFYFVTK